ncbi:MAG: hypothetical protein FWG38_10740 [Defluviitaleaceae bacterium]|nr:hypothetical protein [Defluviitaleaceae bacterium]
MTGKTERVILVKGDASKWYEQAIFIVNPKADKMPVDFVAAAEKIISDYNLNSESTPQRTPYAPKTVVKTRPYKQSLDKSDIVLSVLMMLACVALAGIFVYGLLS